MVTSFHAVINLGHLHIRVNPPNTASGNEVMYPHFAGGKTKTNDKTSYPKNPKRNHQIKDKKGKEPPELNMLDFKNLSCAVNYYPSTHLLWGVILWINFFPARKSAFILKS